MEKIVDPELTTEKIAKLWFSDDAIYIMTDSGKEYRKALVFLPILKQATPSQREQYEINASRDIVHWKEVFCVLHISSITTENIAELWLSDNEICIRTYSGKVYGKALVFFPTLKEATLAQRERYVIDYRRESVHWPELDEDIHISSIIEEATPLIENKISEVFRQFPVLSVPEMARVLGMHKTKLYKYIYGVYTPSAEREARILDTLREIGRQLANI